MHLFVKSMLCFSFPNVSLSVDVFLNHISTEMLVTVAQTGGKNYLCVKHPYTKNHSLSCFMLI